MAFGMKQWVGLVTVGMVVVAVWRLPPDHFGSPERPPPSEVEVRHGELDTEFRLTAEALRSRLWSDSLSALAVEIADDGFAFALPEYEEDPGELPAQLEERVRRDLEGLERRAPGMVFGYFHQPYDHAHRPDMPYGMQRRTETYVGSRDGVDYCLQVRVGRRDDVNALLNDADGTSTTPPATNTLGLCRWYLQYGPPGASIDEWRRRGGSGFGIEVGAQPEVPEELVTMVRMSRVFGFGRLGSRSAPIEISQCRAGSEEACGMLLTSPDMGSETETWKLEVTLQGSAARRLMAWSGAGGMPVDAAYILADLESEFGPDAFERFWTSNDEVGVAFENAFETTAGAWMVTWMERVGGTTPASPALPRTASSGSALAVALLVGLAFIRNRKRSVV